MKDFLGQELVVGDYVAGLYSANETPAMFIIEGFTPKTCTLRPLHVADPARTNYATVRKFGKDLIKLDSAAVIEAIAQIPVDALLRPLSIGDYVYGSAGEYIDPVIFEITSFAPRVAMVKVVYPVGRYVTSLSKGRLTSDLIKIEPQLVTMHCLTKENTNE